MPPKAITSSAKRGKVLIKPNKAWDFASSFAGYEYLVIKFFSDPATLISLIAPKAH